MPIVEQMGQQIWKRVYFDAPVEPKDTFYATGQYLNSPRISKKSGAAVIPEGLGVGASANQIGSSVYFSLNSPYPIYLWLSIWPNVPISLSTCIMTCSQSDLSYCIPANFINFKRRPTVVVFVSFHMTSMSSSAS